VLIFHWMLILAEDVRGEAEHVSFALVLPSLRLVGGW